MPKFEIILTSRNSSVYKIVDFLMPRGSEYYSTNRKYFKILKDGTEEEFARNGAIYLPRGRWQEFQDDLNEKNPGKGDNEIRYWEKNKAPFIPDIICKESFFNGYLLEPSGRICYLKDIENRIGGVFASGIIRTIELPPRYRTIQERIKSVSGGVTPAVREVPQSSISDLEKAIGKSRSAGTIGSSDPKSPFFLKKKK